MIKKRTKVVLISIPIIIIMAIVSPFIIAPLLNDFALHNFSKQLYNYPLPLHTKILEKHDACGKLNGNGNGMDFMATMLVKSDLTSNELNDYYSKATFNYAKNESTMSKDKIAFEIVKPTSPNLESDYLEHQGIFFDRLKNINSYSNYYIVILYDGGYSADFDIRGH
jgi:hypothetical protein